VVSLNSDVLKKPIF